MSESMLELDPSCQEIAHVQEEPALEIALPQVFTQPPLIVLQRGKLPHVEWLIARVYRASAAQPTANGHGLGPEYQAVVNEFQPLFAWAMACWDYLLSTEGCRFVLRSGDEKMGCRGDYRAVTDVDYSRMLHRIFRQCVLDFAQTSGESSLSGYLRAHFWETVRAAYQKLEEPADPRQRTLTAYSYLRCVPYRFLNDFHHDLVHQTIRRLPSGERLAIEGYFLKFLTLDATAQALRLPADTTASSLRQGLLTLLIEDRLVYCLLRQIERY